MSERSQWEMLRPVRDSLRLLGFTKVANRVTPIRANFNYADGVGEIFENAHLLTKLLELEVGEKFFKNRHFVKVVFKPYGSVEIKNVSSLGTG